MGDIAAWLLALAVAAGCLLASRGLIHYFQLESYQFPGYFRTLRRQGIRAWGIGPLFAAILLAALWQRVHLPTVKH